MTVSVAVTEGVTLGVGVLDAVALMLDVMLREGEGEAVSVTTMPVMTGIVMELSNCAGCGVPLKPLRSRIVSTGNVATVGRMRR